jgi:hypothetical protein
MEIQLGKTYWNDEEPEVYGERLSFDDLQTIEEGEIVLVEDDAEVEPYGAVAARLYSLDDVCAKFDRGTSKLIVVCREDMDESDEDGGDFAMVWRIRNHDKQEIKEEPEMIVTENRTPPADANLAVTEQYTTAYNLNVKIHTSMQAIQQNLYDMCSALKQMRDGKLYKELGYQNFDEYCKEEAGISRRHAYRYIAIIEKLPSDFVSPGSQIGEHKLYLLTALTDDQREEITQTVDLESTTVRELKAQIAALQSQNANTEKARADAEERAQKWYDEAESKGRQLTENHAKLVKSEERNGRLQEQIEELENRPVEVAVPEPSHELQNMQDAMRRINLEHEQWSAKIQDDHIRHVQEINRQHRAETDALRAEYEEKLAAAQAAPAEAPDSKEVFKAYLAAVIDAAKRMMAFLSAHPDDACRTKAEKAFQTMLQEVNNEQTV